MYEYFCGDCWESFYLTEVIQSIHCPHCGEKEFTYLIVIDEPVDVELQIASNENNRDNY